MAVFRRVWLLRRNGILEFIRWLVRIPWLEVAVLTNSSLTTSGFAESFLSNPKVSKIICSWVNLKCFRVTSLKDTSCRGTIWTFWNLEKQKKRENIPGLNFGLWLVTWNFHCYTLWDSWDLGTSNCLLNLWKKWRLSFLHHLFFPFFGVFHLTNATNLVSFLESRFVVTKNSMEIFLTSHRSCTWTKQ